MRLNKVLQPGFGILLVALLTSTAAQARDAQDILQKSQQLLEQRQQGVDVYLVEKTVMGHTTRTYHRRTSFTAEDGSQQTAFIPYAEHQLTGSCSGAQKMTPEQLMAFADASEMTGEALSGEIESGMQEAGLPPGLLASTGSSPNATMDPRVMMGGNAQFLRAAARAQAAEDNRDVAGEAREQADHMAVFAQQARLIGTENVGNNKAFHLRADGVNQVQRDEGREYRIDTVSMWIDDRKYVPLRMKIEGTLTSGAEVKPMVIETLMSDYRNVPGSKLYEPFTQTMKISGIMDAAQEAEMREAQKQLADMEKQMASVPASQRAMMERMIGPQLEMVRKMAAGGGLEMETVTDRIVVNPSFTLADGTNCGASAAKAVKTSSKSTAQATSPMNNDTELVALVQSDLRALGYSPGSVDGKMGTRTAIAISKFQAEQGLEVTGEASPQLAGILAAQRSAQASPQKAPVVSTTASNSDDLRAAQQACLQQKIAEQQEAQKKKRGFGRLLSGVSRIAGRMGNTDIARSAGDIYSAGNTAEDFSQAAKDLGLTEDEVAACQNP